MRWREPPADASPASIIHVYFHKSRAHLVGDPSSQQFVEAILKHAAVDANGWQQ